VSYKVTVEFAPAYELAISLDAYMVAPSHRTIDLGESWLAEVRGRLTPAFAAELAQSEPLDYRLLGQLIQQCPGERDAESFLRWLGSLSAGELYELLAPSPVAGDLGALRDRIVGWLGQWHQAYFRHVEPGLLAGLAADAERVRGLALPPELLVEEATRGYYLAPGPQVESVLLVPQYHKRPITLQAPVGGLWLFYYPTGDLPGPAGEVPVELLRLMRTLADESRLRIFHFLAGGARSFGEVGAYTGLTKGTVHRHLWALRFAGLVRADLADGRFSLRPGAVERVAAALGRFAFGR
jgi:DNA-binding transcriptional ArsR family regulator